MRWCACDTRIRAEDAGVFIQQPGGDGRWYFTTANRPYLFFNCPWCDLELPGCVADAPTADAPPGDDGPE